MYKIKDYIKNNREHLVIIFILVFSALTHGYNMFHFPYYENDEGTYMSQAWSILTQGRIAPYTYWYDHAPAGWILIALWVKLTGGFFTFGSSINSGRVLMLIIHVLTSFLLYKIAKKLSNNQLAGIIAVIIFSLSPLAVYFQRRVLLDNIMTFWIFVSLYFLLFSKQKLTSFFLSALAFGLAVLTKENAIFFLPPLLYVLNKKTQNDQKTFAFLSWIIISFSLISTYFLYALLKDELFPPDFLGSSGDHVSLLGTLKTQLTRGNELPFWNRESEFYNNFQTWLSKDSVTIISGAVATALSLILSIKYKYLRIPVLFSLFFWFFLLRGKLVIEFYIIPLIPFLSLNTGILTTLLVQKVSFKNRYVYNLMALPLIGSSLYLPIRESLKQFTKDETSPQIQAIDWIKNNLNENDYIAIDDYSYVDLHAQRFPGDKVFKNADWFWKIYYDPEVRYGKYNEDWKKVEYIALSHEILKQMGLGTQDFIENAFINSQEVITWKKDTYLDIDNKISTNGDWIAIYKLKDESNIILSHAWVFYKNNFIQPYGQVIDPTNNNITTSEGQAYALLRSVYLNDKTTFDGVWKWTQDHLQKRTQDKLISWLWSKNGQEYKLADSNSASDADEDTTLALLFAYKKWHEEKYLSDAREMINDIWKKEVVFINGEYVMTMGTDALRGDVYIVNPSYVSPATYKIFATIDPKNDWNKLAEDSYKLLDNISSRQGSNNLLPPNWLSINKNTGEISSASKYIGDGDVNNFGFDAFRLMWRVALDAKWNNDPRAITYLNKYTDFYKTEW